MPGDDMNEKCLNESTSTVARDASAFYRAGVPEVSPFWKGFHEIS